MVQLQEANKELKSEILSLKDDLKMQRKSKFNNLMDSPAKNSIMNESAEVLETSLSLDRNAYGAGLSSVDS